MLTGANGIVGQHVKEILQQSSQFIDIKCFDGDILDVANIEKQVNGLKELDEVIHLAACVEIDAVKKSPAQAFAVNVGGTCNLLNRIVSSGFKPHFFLCSTAHVYRPSKLPIKEEGELSPISIYGKTKLMSEIVSAEICQEMGLEFCIGRVFSIHDPKQKGTFLRPNIIKRLQLEDLSGEFHLLGGESVRDFLTAREAANLIVELSKYHFHGVVNIGSGRPKKIKDFVQELTDVSLNIKSFGENNSVIANIEKLTEFLRWSSDENV